VILRFAVGPMRVAFQPGEAAVDVEVALFADEPSDRKEVAEVQSVPPTRTERKGRALSLQISSTFLIK
jgi:hypothetical protein